MTVRSMRNTHISAIFRQIIEADVENHDIGRLEELRCMFRGDFFENRYFSDLEEFEELMIMQRYILENKRQVILKKADGIIQRK